MSVPDGSKNTQFHSYCEDQDGIWFGCLGKIYRYSFENGELRLFLDITEHGPFLFSNICDLDPETLLCTSNNGSVLIDKKTGEIFESPFGRTEEISSAMIDSQERVWIALYNKGIWIYDNTGQLLKSYTKDNSGHIRHERIMPQKKRRMEYSCFTDDHEDSSAMVSDMVVHFMHNPV